MTEEENNIKSPSTTSSEKEIKINILDGIKKVIPTLILPDLNDLPILDTKVSHWDIKDWKHLESRSHSPVINAGHFNWRILLFPKGNGVKDMVSLYLEVLQENLPAAWSVCAQFALIISNPNDPTNYYANYSHHRFTAEEVDWGFTRYFDIKELENANQHKGPFLVNDEINITVCIRVVKDVTGVLWHNLINYDSRKETGFVGIKNQGATCYMNSLLQSLYCINQFRKAVYQIPTQREDPTKNVALALQRLFYNLEYASDSVGTTELTKSFGWDSADSFMQHDVQEFSRVLLDNLELKMKNTPSDGAIKQLFVGKMKSYIKCIDVDYESSRVEDFYDIQLNVMGCKNIKESFEFYIQEEIMDGENKYMAEGHGLQNARKGVVFESFPPVLHLQLKRFEYNVHDDTMIKINDHHQYPDELCLDEFCNDSTQSYTYQLHSVLVHSGDLDGGHYFALIKPNKDGKWLRFDDEHVTPVTNKEVFEDNYGDEPTRKLIPIRDDSTITNESTNHQGKRLRGNSLRSLKRFTNAYMLVYIQKNKLDEILGTISDEDIPSHLRKFIFHNNNSSNNRLNYING
ncbi:hypothetical protein BJ944DRAFT_237359 [Cunninghamella echinulata]|nr:hypothetical protein BJ944DRAFT_237359 [Cunninghamella echinulata]